MPGTECRIVCIETGRVLAAGESGEVLIRGPQVMKGYWNNPEATAATIDSDGWLHTGDIGVVDEEGYLTVVDRLKELIKVKGYQVAPAELESLLLEHPQIADIAVIPVADEEAGEVPKACVVARGQLTDVRRHGVHRPARGALQAHSPRGVHGRRFRSRRRARSCGACWWSGSAPVGNPLVTGTGNVTARRHELPRHEP